MAALAPAASALAVVVVVETCAAETETAPLVVRVAPDPKRAAVLLLTIESATTGVIETPPVEPDSAVVVTACVAVAGQRQGAKPRSAPRCQTLPPTSGSR